MTRRDTAPLGAPSWIDLMTSDMAGSEAFYAGLFGWSFERGGEEFGGYSNFLFDGHPVGGCMPSVGIPGASDGWGLYLAVADAQQVAGAAVAHGGQVLSPPLAVGDLGTMVTVTDVGGAVISGWQAGRHPGFVALAEPNAPGWFELHTRDYDATVGFYTKVFGWETHVASDIPEFRYTTLGKEEEAMAGVMDAGAILPEGTPAHWSVYFQVEDTDAAVAKVTELGGSVTHAPEDTPFGRLAAVTDPNGAAFKLVDG